MVQLSGGTYLNYIESSMHFNFSTPMKSFFSFLGYLMIHIASGAKPYLNISCSVGIKHSHHL